MPTRFYLPSSGSAPAAPAYSSQWEQTSYATRLPAVTAKTDTAKDEATTKTYDTLSTVHDILRAQFVSEPLPAGTISGSLRASIGAYVSSAAGANGYVQIVARVVSGDGATERGVLYAGQSATTTTTTADAINQQIEGSTAFPTRIYPDTALSSVVVQAGDRLVIEVGWRACNTASTSRWGNLMLGDPLLDTNGDPTVDAPHSAGVATQALAAGSPLSWVEFSQDLFAAGPPAVPSLTLSGTAAAATAAFVLDSTPPPAEITLAGTASPATAAFTLDAPPAFIEVTLAGTAQAAAAAFTLDSAASVAPVETSTRYANDGYGYDGMADVYNEPAIEPTPAHIPRSTVLQVHQSMSAPNLVNGVPR